MSQTENQSQVVEDDFLADTLSGSPDPIQANEPAMTERHKLPSLWRQRHFMLLWSGQLLSSMGTQVSQLAFPLLVLAVTSSPAQAGIIGALRGLPFVFLCLPAGAMIDRWDRKRVMLICDSGRALVLGSIPLALWLGHLTLWQLDLVALIEGTLMTFFSIAETASLPHVVAREQLPQATAQNQAIDSSSWTLGPLLGGLLYALGSAIPFLADAISYVCSVLGLLFIRVRFQEERVTETRRIWQEIGEGLLWLWREPLLRFLAFLICGLVMPSIGFSLILITLAQTQHATPQVIGILFASGGIGSIVGTLLTAPLQKRLTFGQLTIGAAWIWAISWLALAIAPNLFVLDLANAVSFIIVPILLSSQYSYRLLVIPDQLQGRVQSVFRLISFGMQPLGVALTGFLIQWIGPVWAVIVLFVPQAIFALVATLYPRLREAPGLHTLAEQAQP
jgi:MFS family permease